MQLDEAERFGMISEVMRLQAQGAKVMVSPSRRWSAATYCLTAWPYEVLQLAPERLKGKSISLELSPKQNDLKIFQQILQMRRFGAAVTVTFASTPVQETLSSESLEIPTELRCPITEKLMSDPMMLVESGETYEREAIINWLKENDTDFVTNYDAHDNCIVKKIGGAQRKVPAWFQQLMAFEGTDSDGCKANSLKNNFSVVSKRSNKSKNLELFENESLGMEYALYRFNYININIAKEKELLEGNLLWYIYYRCLEHRKLQISIPNPKKNPRNELTAESTQRAR